MANAKFPTPQHLATNILLLIFALVEISAGIEFLREHTSASLRLGLREAIGFLVSDKPARYMVLAVFLVLVLAAGLVAIWRFLLKK